MGKKKKREFGLRGGQLLSSGDVIQVMDGNSPVTCRVWACRGTEDGGCLLTFDFPGSDGMRHKRLEMGSMDEFFDFVQMVQHESVIVLEWLYGGRFHLQEGGNDEHEG